jgi:hypothetical protein
LSLTPLEVLLLALSPFTAIGIWERRAWLKAQFDRFTKPKKATPYPPKEGTH